MAQSLMKRWRGGSSFFLLASWRGALGRGFGCLGEEAFDDGGFEEELGAGGQQFYFVWFGGLGWDIEDAAGRKVDAEVAGFDFKLDFAAGDEGFGKGELEDTGFVGENFVAGGEEGDLSISGKRGGGRVAGIEEAADEKGLGLGEGSEEEGESETEHWLFRFLKAMGEGDGIGLCGNDLAFVAGFGKGNVESVVSVRRDGEGEGEVAVGKCGGVFASGFDGDVGDTDVLAVEDAAVEGRCFGGEAVGGEPD